MKTSQGTATSAILLAASSTGCGRRWFLLGCLPFILVAAPHFAACRAAETAPLDVEVSGLNDRRDRQDPELVIESGGRTGTCDALTFTADGERLLAVGDDKVVRVWHWTGAELRADMVLRWSIWREQRGSIYALALSPDKEGKLVAIAGHGLRTGTVMVLDRATGAVRHVLKDTTGSDAAGKKKKANNQTIRALAFGPAGERVAFGTEEGAVWLWQLDRPQATWLGRFDPSKGEFNRVRCLAFLPKGRLLGVAQSGQVLRWDLNDPGQKAETVLQIGAQLYRAGLTPDGHWLVALTAGREENFIAIRSLDGRRNKDILLKTGEYARSFAVEATGKQLAVGIGSLSTRTKPFYAENSERLSLVDLTAARPALGKGPRPTYHAECLAFHPGTNLLACAGGSNHDVTVWDLARHGEVISEAVGQGSCLWGVGLSKNGRQLGFADRRDPQGAGLNQRAHQDSWRVFDLEERDWVPARNFQPVEQLEKVDGWTVEPDPKDAFVWYASRRGQRHRLPLDRGRDDIPLCFTFLKATEQHPRPRLLVGHFWGASVFDLKKNAVRRTRLFTGHQSKVMAVAVAADQRWLVTASRDQTVAAWSLDEWPYQSELGADFARRDGGLFVRNVAAGSPAWEAGLIEGDEVITLVRDGREVVYNRTPVRIELKVLPALGTTAAAQQALQAPEPGRQLFFCLRRAGRPRPLAVSTTVRQRPLWRFFPTRSKEWVQWLWRKPLYDCSTNGDALLGWQVSDRDLDRAPAFYPLAFFRQRYHRPEVLDALLKTRDVAKALPADSSRLSFEEIEPPAVRLELASGVDPRNRAQGDLEVRIVVDPRGKNPDQVPLRVELWINDYRYRSYPAGGDNVVRKDTIPRDLLRAGENVLKAQAISRGR